MVADFTIFGALNSSNECSKVVKARIESIVAIGRSRDDPLKEILGKKKKNHKKIT